MLMRTLKTTDAKTKKLAFLSVILPILEYCCIVWFPFHKKQMKQLESIQRKAFRWAFKIRRRDPISDRMREEGWKSLEDRFKNRDLVTYHKIISETFPYEFDTRHFPHGYGTRAGMVKIGSRLDIIKNYYGNRIVDRIFSH